jgi:hypothetical protein
MAQRSASVPSLLELEAARPGRRASRRASGGSGSGGRSSRPMERWLARLGSLAALGAAIWFLLLLRRDVEAGRYGEIAADRVRLDVGPGWFDPRWEHELALRVAAHGTVDPDDRAALRALAADVGALSFVRAVDEPTVIWPDGLTLGFELRQPIACVVAPPGRQYAALDLDGVVLSGRWSAPPDRASGFLPLLWSSDGAYPEPGARLDDPAIVDGLAVAAALWRELPPAVLARLGRTVIDARRSRLTSPDEPGTLLLLEDGREVVFGRSPNLDAPGETPVHLKLRSLARALEPGVAPWILVDLRWDRPEILVDVPREAPEAPAQADGY